jgi:nitrate reductase molybdenum cofactor assembly chaperone NarJ/NarW
MKPLFPKPYSLRALARLLRYPDAALRPQLPALLEVLEAEPAISSQQCLWLRQTVHTLTALEPLALEAMYVDTFDRGRRTALHLFEHVHGDSRDRGQAMIDLLQTYEQAGLFLAPDELPDHLCVVLEFTSTLEPPVARDFLGEVTHILHAIFSALEKQQSPYAAVLAAVLEIAGENPTAQPLPDEVLMDEAWAEPEAFNGCTSMARDANAAKPIHFMHQATPSQPTAA